MFSVTGIGCRFPNFLFFELGTDADSQIYLLVVYGTGAESEKKYDNITALGKLSFWNCGSRFSQTSTDTGHFHFGSFWVSIFINWLTLLYLWCLLFFSISVVHLDFASSSSLWRWIVNVSFHCIRRFGLKSLINARLINPLGLPDDG